MYSDRNSSSYSISRILADKKIVVSSRFLGAPNRDTHSSGAPNLLRFPPSVLARFHVDKGGLLVADEGHNVTF
jgi:hypothetical protein